MHSSTGFAEVVRKLKSGVGKAEFDPEFASSCADIAMRKGLVEEP